MDEFHVHLNTTFVIVAQYGDVLVNIKFRPSSDCKVELVQLSQMAVTMF